MCLEVSKPSTNVTRWSRPALAARRALRLASKAAVFSLSLVRPAFAWGRKKVVAKPPLFPPELRVKIVALVAAAGVTYSLYGFVTMPHRPPQSEAEEKDLTKARKQLEELLAAKPSAGPSRSQQKRAAIRKQALPTARRSLPTGKRPLPTTVKKPLPVARRPVAAKPKPAAAASPVTATSSVSSPPKTEKKAAPAPAPAPTPAPVAAPTPAPKPKRNLLNLFGKRQVSKVPSPEELAATEGPEGTMYATLKFAMLAPVDVPATAAKAIELQKNEGEGLTEQMKGDMAMADAVIEELQESSKTAATEGLDTGAIAKLTEKMGSAVTVQLVDAGFEALGKKDSFTKAAAALCRFVGNAQVVAEQLNVTEQLGEVLYDGALGRRQIEKFYRELIELTAPEMLKLVPGMEELITDEVPEGVSLMVVEQIAALLKIKDAKAQSLQAEVMAKQMEESSKHVEKDPDKALTILISSLQQFVDMGDAMPPDQLLEIKKQMTDSLGMPVEEFLENKDRILDSNAFSSNQGEKLFDCLEALFGDKKPAPKPVVADEPNPNVKVKIAAGKAANRTMDDALESPTEEGVKVSIKKKPKK